jgi:[amino group carrier protein]-lysine/ornithine hydrolase
MTREDAVALVRGLVAIPSLSRHEHDAARWLAARMAAAGYDRAYVDAAGNAVGEVGALQARNVIVLLGHIDTVPGNIPVRIEGEPPRLYGRGSVDAKGPLATFAAAGARLGSRWAHEAGVRLVVVGAVEEEAATSKGARFIGARFDGRAEPVPAACVIGEPSSWRRITLGYKGRLLLNLSARQAMSHTAGPGFSVAEVVVGLWNRVRSHADSVNAGLDKPFEQLSPSLRRFITANEEGLTDTVDAEFAWRLPVGFDAEAFVRLMIAQAAAQIEAAEPVRVPSLTPGADGPEPITIAGPRTRLTFAFRGWERPWRSDRQNALVRSFLAGVRQVDSTVQPSFVVKTGTSDMNVVAPVWGCPIVAYGPGDSALDHTPDEHLDLHELWTAVQVLEASMRHLALSLA